ncbi:MAG TPA: hypothetical protein VHT95_09390 [Vicinamibacterales bacterium]|nr:hypothetical protein [Vicinamibacterales bacterium]
MIRPMVLSAVLLFAAAPLSAQPPASTPATQVLTSLTVRADIDRGQLMKVMPDEVRETLKLYLDGKIQQWYSRSDGRGVVFILNCTTAAEAKAITDRLPLSKANLATFEYTPLGPLAPLRMLLQP